MDGCGGVHEKVNETPADTGFDDGLDLVVGPVREIGNGPASIDENLVIDRVDKLGEDVQCRCNLIGVVKKSVHIHRIFENI